MRFPGFVGPSYQLSSVNYDCQRSVNLYPEIDELHTGKEGEVAALVGTPGLTLLATLGNGPIRGMWYSSTGVLYVVSGGTLYSVNNVWQATSLGSLNTIVGQVSMSDNGSQLVVVDGQYGYYVNMAATGTPTQYTFTITPGQTASVNATYTNNGQTFTVTTALTNTATTLIANGTGDPSASGSLTLSSIVGTGTGPIVYSAFTSIVYNKLFQINAANFLGADIVTFQDGYFIFNQPGTNKFFISDLDDVTFNAPSVSSKEGTPEDLLSLVSCNRTLWLFGAQSTECWFDAGDNNNPFQYAPGTLRQYGCAAKFSALKFMNTVFWLGQDTNGAGMVFMANGYEPVKISTQAVERAIQSYSDISDAVAYSYQENGHQFYVLTFPTGNATWVYDLSTQMWHERAYYFQGALNRHRSICHSYAYNTHVVGDYATGAIYQQSLSTYTDNGNPLIRIRVAPHIAVDMHRVIHSRLQLDIESGVGVDGNGQGVSPKAMLQWSNDGGHSWSSEVWADMGAIGARKKRAVWRRLGHARDRVYRVMVSDPVKVAIIGAELEVIPAAS